MAVSLDGRHVATQVIGADGVIRLAVRSLESLEVRVFSGTDGAGSPFWSPDSDAIGYSAQGALLIVPLAGGIPRTVCKLDFKGPALAHAGTWSRRGLIVFEGGLGEGLYQVPSSGGSPTRLTTLNPSRGEDSHLSPLFLPDGNHFLYFRRSRDPQHSGIYIGNLNAPNGHRLLISGGGRANFVDARPGVPACILFTRELTPYAQPFDMDSMLPSGAPIPIPGVTLTTDTAMMSTSPNGVLAFRGNADLGSGRLTWFTRSGLATGHLGPPGDYRQISLSPDASSVAVAKVPSQGTGSDIWTINAATGAATKLTFSKASYYWYPVWSPDGSSVVFRASTGGAMETRKVAVSFPGEEQIVIPQTQESVTLSPGSRFIAYAHDRDIWVIPASGKAEPFRILKSPYVERHPQLSQDGRLLAYTSEESGQSQVHVMEFGDPPSPTSRRYQVSVNGGSHPRWSRDGRELYFLSPDRKLMAVAIGKGAIFSSSPPVELFQTQLQTRFFLYGYDVAPDGRFLLHVPASDTGRFPMTVITNWRPQKTLEGK